MNQAFANLPTLLTLVASTANSGEKAFGRLGVLAKPAAQVAAIARGLSNTTFNLLVDTNGVRHTLAQYGIAKRKAEEAQRQIPITEADIAELASWPGRPAAVRNGQAKPGKQPRLPDWKCTAPRWMAP